MRELRTMVAHSEYELHRLDISGVCLFLGGFQLG